MINERTWDIILDVKIYFHPYFVQSMYYKKFSTIDGNLSNVKYVEFI